MYEIYINKPTKAITLHTDDCAKTHLHGKNTTTNGMYCLAKNKEDADKIINDYTRKGYKGKECSFCMSS